MVKTGWSTSNGGGCTLVADVVVWDIMTDFENLKAVLNL